MVYTKKFERLQGWGSCQVRKIQKSEKNSDWPDNTHPPPYPKNKQKTHKKHKISTTKIRVGAWPTHPL